MFNSVCDSLFAIIPCQDAWAQTCIRSSLFGREECFPQYDSADFVWISSRVTSTSSGIAAWSRLWSWHLAPSFWSDVCPFSLWCSSRWSPLVARCPPLHIRAYGHRWGFLYGSRRPTRQFFSWCSLQCYDDSCPSGTATPLGSMFQFAERISCSGFTGTSYRMGWWCCCAYCGNALRHIKEYACRGCPHHSWCVLAVWALFELQSEEDWSRRLLSRWFRSSTPTFPVCGAPWQAWRAPFEHADPMCCILWAPWNHFRGWLHSSTRNCPPANPCHSGDASGWQIHTSQQTRFCRHPLETICMPYLSGASSWCRQLGYALTEIVSWFARKHHVLATIYYQWRVLDSQPTHRLWAAVRLEVAATCIETG